MTEVTAQPKNPERLELEQLTALQPGLARLMPEIGARFWKAYYAAQAANWPLAAWQLREMRKLLKLCEVTRPKYTDDIEEWMHDDLDPLMAALDAHDLVAFEKHYHEGVDFCERAPQALAEGMDRLEAAGHPAAGSRPDTTGLSPRPLAIR